MSRTLSRYNRVKREEETKSYKEIRNIVLEILRFDWTGVNKYEINDFIDSWTRRIVRAFNEQNNRQKKMGQKVRRSIQ